jgi:hypothetical protein
VSEQLYKALWLLKNPQMIEIVDELLDILGLTIVAEGGMEGDLCQIVVTALQTVVAQDKGNLHTVVNILNVLNSAPVAKQVVFQWGDMVRFLSTLYLNYFQDFVQKEYTNLYKP